MQGGTEFWHAHGKQRAGEERRGKEGEGKGRGKDRSKNEGKWKGQERKGEDPGGRIQRREERTGMESRAGAAASIVFCLTLK